MTSTLSSVRRADRAEQSRWSESATLRIRALSTTFAGAEGPVRAVDDVSFDVRRGELLGVVGESGCGKSAAALSVMRIVPPTASCSGEVWLDGVDVAVLSERELRRVRGRDLAMVFQNPAAAFNPLLTVGHQIAEVMAAHRRVGRAEAFARARDLLTEVGIADAEARLGDHPHRFSGGMLQRAAIAMAMAGDPSVLIADEVTTALDVTTQAQVLGMLRRLAHDRGTALVMITHDMGVIAEATDRVLVMYAGQVVESCSTTALFASPRMPYTWGLLDAVPSLDADRDRPLRTIDGAPPSLSPPPTGCRFAARCEHRRSICEREMPPLQAIDEGTEELHEVRCWGAQDVDGGGWLLSGRPNVRSGASSFGNAVRATDGCDVPLLEVRDVEVAITPRRSLLAGRQDVVRAVDGVNLDIARGETLGLVGESGCGKSTLARAIVHGPPSGTVRFDGLEARSLAGATLRGARRRLQLVPQDPYQSLDPRRTVGSALRDPIAHHFPERRGESEAIVRDLLAQVGLGVEVANRLPRQLSGGQSQRVAIARALAVEPELIVADEPVSALDVSVQAQILNLLSDLRSDTGVALMLIAHDLAVVRHISDRVAVMYLGRIVETGPTDEIFESPRHPYTQALLSAVPAHRPGERREQIVLHGDPPSASAVPTGCRFHTRCPLRLQLGSPRECSELDPPVIESAVGHHVACHFA